MSKVLGDVKLRSWGFQPELSDREVITMDIVDGAGNITYEAADWSLIWLAQ